MCKIIVTFSAPTFSALTTNTGHDNSKGMNFWKNPISTTLKGLTKVMITGQKHDRTRYYFYKHNSRTKHLTTSYLLENHFFPPAKVTNIKLHNYVSNRSKHHSYFLKTLFSMLSFFLSTGLQAQQYMQCCCICCDMTFPKAKLILPMVWLDCELKYSTLFLTHATLN